MSYDKNVQNIQYRVYRGIMNNFHDFWKRRSRQYNQVLDEMIQNQDISLKEIKRREFIKKQSQKDWSWYYGENLLDVLINCIKDKEFQVTYKGGELIRYNPKEFDTIHNVGIRMVYE